MEEEHAVPVRPGDHARPGVAVTDGAVAAGACALGAPTLTHVAQPLTRRALLWLALQDRVEHPSKDYSTQKLLLGTHTSDNEQNYLMIAEVQARHPPSVRLWPR